MLSIILNIHEDLPSAIATFSHAGLQPHDFLNLTDSVKYLIMNELERIWCQQALWTGQGYDPTRLIRLAIFVQRCAKVEGALVCENVYGEYEALVDEIIRVLSAMTLHRYLTSVLPPILVLHANENAGWASVERLRVAICATMVQCVFSRRLDVSPGYRPWLIVY